MAKPVPSGPPPAPIVQRLVIRYAKRGRMRFASHRDVARAIERGVRKAGVPIAYSAGFSPHPRISYSGGAPTGSASEAEYLELSVIRRCEPADIGRRLDAALPDGIDVVEVVEADGKSAGLALDASEWEVVWPGVAPAAAQSAVQALLAAPSAEVERLTNKGLRRMDARQALVSLSVIDPAQAHSRRAEQGTATGSAILRMTVRQLTPAVRPDDVLTALRQSSPSAADLAPVAPPVVTRLRQGPISDLAASGTGITAGMQARGVTANLGPVTEPSPVQHRPDEPGPGQNSPYGPQSRPEQDRPGRTTDKAMCLDAESAEPAPVGQARAIEQLPRGTQDRLAHQLAGEFADQRAREPDGRDCPDARNGVTESTAGSP
jgi:radical SAM-linked protein